MPIAIKRIYKEMEKPDGFRILIDRVWPRGVSKEKAYIDEWVKEVGPSKALRQWFQHDPEKFQAFKVEYKNELQENEQQHEALERLKTLTKTHEKNITLIFAAKEETYNHARVLKEILDRQLFTP
ncbi:DUF488 domain-containing protein [Salicibibacter kimchii]|uniref:DUF488 family protein n=1 Tax=Salicibibacter kimchii TaxID=2099786 RepID=A0A345C1V2_9BACI|nr:DUF488 family protein [Salicibibacter kimchii]AXF57183.1 DUF488 family protein [Salicibibacter kimchii]